MSTARAVLGNKKAERILLTGKLLETQVGYSDIYFRIFQLKKHLNKS